VRRVDEDVEAAGLRPFDDTVVEYLHVHVDPSLVVGRHLARHMRGESEP
jgi:hypothetical protein